MTYSRNAFLRLLTERGLELDTLSVMHGIRAMAQFCSDFTPQHGESDQFVVAWGPVGESFELRLERRMQRHDHPDVTLSLVFVYPSRGRVDAAEAPVSTWREATETDGYRAIRGARPIDRRLDQG